jgi:flagellar basal body P-ring protein FlgI
MSAAGSTFGAGSRIKDIAMIAGARDNQLSGFGLVTGLAGDGDKNPIDTIQTIANMLQRYGLTVPASTLSAKNVAVVMVTADIPAFAKPGGRLDVVVSSMGDAKSLQGGVLIQTPMLGADGKVYAVAQGTLSIGGLSAGDGGAGGATVQKNHPTVGTIVNGALIEREIPATVISDNHLELMLREPDFTSAARMALAVNEKFTDSAVALDATSVRVKVPSDWGGSAVDFIAQLEMLEDDARHPGAHCHQRAHRHHCGDGAHSYFQLRHRARQRDDQHRFQSGCFPARGFQPDRHDHGDLAHRRQDQRGQRRDGGLAGIAHGGEGGLGFECSGRHPARHDVHV